tara:strand:- start:667 stop:897 length:231 start_codon:yes stop_codon:yes gene_type:complete
MSNFKTYLTNWKIVVPVLCGALIVGVFAFNGDAESDQTNTPAEETTAQTQVENVNVEAKTVTLEENNSQAAQNTEE